MRGANDSNKRRIIKSVVKAQKADLVCFQEIKIQSLSCSLVQFLRVGRFLEWGALNSWGMAVVEKVNSLISGLGRKEKRQCR